MGQSIEETRHTLPGVPLSGVSRGTFNSPSNNADQHVPGPSCPVVLLEVSSFYYVQALYKLF